MSAVAEFKPGYALCPLPPPVPNVTFTHEEPCGAEFWTDEKGDYWYHRWCEDHGEPDECPDAVQRIYSIPEYRRLTALDIRTVE